MMMVNVRVTCPDDGDVTVHEVTTTVARWFGSSDRYWVAFLCPACKKRTVMNINLPGFTTLVANDLPVNEINLVEPPYAPAPIANADDVLDLIEEINAL
jgi:hypothetical protein